MDTICRSTAQARTTLKALALAILLSTPALISAQTATAPDRETLDKVAQAIGRDPPPDRSHPASAREFVITTADGSRIAGMAYLASGAEPHATVLLLHGFPGYDGDLDLAHAMRRAGWNVVTFHYRGLWGSPGTFSGAHAIEDAQAALARLHDPQVARSYGIDTRRIVLFGYSLGGFIALHVAAEHSDQVMGAGVIAAVNVGPLMAGVRKPEEYQAVRRLIDTSAPVVGATPDEFLSELKAHATDWDYDRYVDKLKTLPILVIHSSDRFASQNATFAEALRRSGDTRVDEVGLVTDHDFSDHRIAMEEAALTWLAGLNRG